MLNEDVRLKDFENYQEPTISQLISDGWLVSDEQGFVKIKKEAALLVIGMLNKDEVASYWAFPQEIRDIIDKMETDGLVGFENTFFSKPEQSYLNYYLNKSEFTNGLDLRNRYVHGTNGDTDEEHGNVYLTILKLFVLVVLKIDNDLFLNLRLGTESSHN